MKICYVSHDSILEGIGQSQIVSLLNRYQELGHSVNIVSCEKIGWESKHSNLHPQIHWTVLNFGSRGLIGAIGRLVRISQNLPRDFDVYHGRSDLAAAALAFAGRVPYLWDVRGLWVDQKIVIGTLPNNKLIVKIARMLESFAARNAMAMTTLSKEVLLPLEDRNRKLPKLRKVIPTCTDIDKFRHFPELPHQKTIILSGVFNNYYDIKKTQAYLEKYLERGYKTIWFRGHESDRESFNIPSLEIRNATYWEMPANLALASFGICFCKENAGISLKGVMPTKIAEFLAVGRPVLISKGMGDLDKLVIDYRVGVIASDDSDPEKVIKEMENLLADSGVSYRCRQLATNYFNMDVAVRNYLEIYNAMIE